MTAKQELYLRIPVSALAAESRALGSAGGTVAAERTWYNDCKAGIIPAHSGFLRQARNRARNFAGNRRRRLTGE